MRVITQSFRYVHDLTLLQRLLLLLVAVVSVLAALFYTVSADMSKVNGKCQGTAYGRDCYRGYFDNTYDNQGTSVLPEISGGLAIPDDVNSAAEFCSLLKNAYHSGSAQKRTGAAFIYSTIYGKSAPGEGRGVSEAQWNGFCSRMQEYDDAGRIDWKGNVSAGTNSYYQGSNPNDDAFYYNPKNESGIQISYPGGYQYKILRRCANPIGDRCTGNCFTSLWELQPKISGTSGNKVSIDSPSPDRKAYIERDGNGNTSNVRSIFSRIVVPGNYAVPGKGDSDDGPATRYNASTSSVYYKELYDQTHIFSHDTTDLHTDGGYPIDSIEGVDIGKKICWILGVRPPKQSLSGKWRYAEPKCITIVPQPIRPQVQILGYDARLTSMVRTTLSRQLGTSMYYGSWSEYGSISGNRNTNFASAAALKGGSPGTQADWSTLTFANRQSSGSSCGTSGFGCATHPSGGVSYPQKFVDNMRARCPTVSNGTITIPAISDSTTTQFFCTNGTAVISQNITYKDSPTANASSLPQVVVIANDIIINPSVTRIDAWLIAGKASGQPGSTGRISTCSAMGIGANNFPTFSSIAQGSFYARKDACSQPLSVTGPVVSKKLHLYRTTSSQNAGKDPIDSPAERFNLRADAFLWAFNGGTSTPTDPVAQTVSIKELPPRF